MQGGDPREDLEGIAYVYRNFYWFGPSITYNSSTNGVGRGGNMANFAQLMQATDNASASRGFLANEANFRVLKELEEKRKNKLEEEKKRQQELEEKRMLAEEKQKELENKKEERRKQKLYAERQKELERIKQEDDREIIELNKNEQVETEKLQIPKKAIFEKIFGWKKKEAGLAKGVEEIEKIIPKQLKGKKKAVKTTLEMPELVSLKTEKFGGKLTKPEEIVKAEEEIQKAISGIKKAKRPSVIQGLFKRKKEHVAVEEEIETPMVMPRTYDKIDYVELIEEKIHKARLDLMDFRFDDAKKVYIEIMKMYNGLEPKKKSKVYLDIKDLYYERKSAEKFGKQP